MSLCNTCIDPGHCCRAIPLNIDYPSGTLRHVIEHDLVRRGLSFFKPLRKSAPYAKGSYRWLFECTRLGVDGRCTLYEDRPDVCRSYEPKSDALCVYGENSEPENWEAATTAWYEDLAPEEQQFLRSMVEAK